MKKPDTKELTEALSNMDADQLDIVFKAQKDQVKKDDEMIEKLIAHKFPVELKENNTPLTRGEKKELKKHGIDIADFKYMLDDEKDDLLDKLIELRGIDGADDIAEPELNLWATYIITRTLEPLKFEGN